MNVCAQIDSKASWDGGIDGHVAVKVYKDDALFKTFSTHFDELQGGLIALFTQGPDSEAKMVECMKNLSILRGVKSELMKV